MSTKYYNKLVRDKIPEIIESKGQTCQTRMLGDVEYLKELRTKLEEEVQEYLESGELEELADILEVLDGLAVAQGASFEEVVELQKRKGKERGGFVERVFLESVEE
jgi:predicted house-cleaning noncanonical NTP pyrophosphatase (MazG superfamily)